MGKILNGILGGVSGKVGGVVGSNWKGIDTLRAYAIPANPQSAGQTAQRDKFAAVLAFLRLMLTSVIQPFWDPFAVGQSGFNAAMSVNLLAWTDDTAYDDAIVAQGSLEGQSLDTYTYDTSDGACSFDWTENVLGNGLTTDLVGILIVDVENDIAFFSNTVERGETEAFPNIGAGRTAANLKVYVFTNRGSGSSLEVSDSIYYQMAAA